VLTIRRIVAVGARGNPVLDEAVEKLLKEML